MILKYLPVVLQGVVAVENVIGNAAPGAAKKEVILGAVQAATQLGATVDQQEVAVVSALVDNVVGTLNKTGVFTKGVPVVKVPVAQ